MELHYSFYLHDSHWYDHIMFLKDVNVALSNSSDSAFLLLLSLFKLNAIFLYNNNAGDFNAS